MTAEARFEDLVETLTQLHDVTPPASGRGFGSNALRIKGRISAMLVRGHLVLKLPQDRVDSFVRSGHGVRFDANKGTPMKQWLNLDPTAAVDWTSIAREAITFVSPK